MRRPPAFAGAALLAAALLAGDPPVLYAAAAGEPAPLEAASPVSDLEGNTTDLRARVLPGDGSTHKATLLVFWGTWCQPCIHEVPVLNELQRFYGKDGLQVIGIGMSWGGDTLDKVAAAAEQHGMSYPVLFDKDGRARAAFGVTALPTSALIDARGTVRWMGLALPRDIAGRIREALGTGEERGSK